MTNGKSTAFSPLRAYSLLAILFVCYMIAYMDRAALAILVQPVKTDLGVDDTTMGLLIGFAFVLLYTTAGLFAGRLADRGNRKLLILVGMIVWLAATGASGFVTGVATLAAARVLVGLGEAALSPAAYSLIASTFPRERVSFAIALYSLGTVLGTGLGTLIVGLLSGLAAGGLELPGVTPGTGGWRTTFVLLALVAVPVLPLVAMIREPRAAPGGDQKEGAVPSLGEAFAHFRDERRAYAPVILSYSVMSIAAGGAIWWGATWLIRTHGYTASEAATALGTILTVFGTCGMLLGGWLSDRLFRGGMVDAAPRVILFTLVLEAPLFALAYLSGNTMFALAAFAGGIFMFSAQIGLQGASLQLMAPPRMRGTVASLFLLVANILGMGLGPVMIPAAGQHLFGGNIATALGLITPLVVAISLVLLWRALPHYRNRVDATRLQIEG